ncbi:hypothetical protein [Arthrobacter sp. D2-10]
MDAATSATIWAAIATGFSALTVAVQSIFTRQSVNEAKRSADASEKAVNAANATLELAREEANHSAVGLQLAQKQAEQAQLMAAETIRARMEVSAPNVVMNFVHVNEQGHAIPVGYVASEESGSQDDAQLAAVEVGHTFVDPADEDRWLFAVFRVTFRNRSTSPVTLQLHQAFSRFIKSGGVRGRTRYLTIDGYGAEGSSRATFILIGTRLGQLFYVANHCGDRVIGGEGYWSTDLQGDSGCYISQKLEITGSLLRHGARKGEYQLNALGPDINYPSTAVMHRQKRHYAVGDDGHGGFRLLPEDDFSTLA